MNTAKEANDDDGLCTKDCNLYNFVHLRFQIQKKKGSNKK